LPKPLTDKTAPDGSTQQNKPLNELSAADNTPRPANVPTQSSTGDGTPQQESAFRNSADGDSQPQPNSFPDDSLSQKLNPVISQNPANPPKQESKPAVDTSSGSTNFANGLAADNPQNLSVHQPSASQQSANTTGNTWQNVGEQLFTQIQNSVQQNQQQITIRLNPPELGRVVIKFTEQNNQITGLLEVSRPQTRYEIEQALPELLKNLADSGIQIKNFDVLVKDQPQNDFYRDAFAQTGYGDRSSQQNFAEGDAGNFHTPDQPSNTNVAGYQTASVSQQSVITDNSINVLI
jgi:flagellar hook-length control protein FliK